MIVPLVLLVCGAQGLQIKHEGYAEQRAAVLAAQGDEARSSAYRKLFEMVSYRELAAMKHDPDLGIALQAAWEQARVGVPRQAKMAGRIDTVYSPETMGRFVEFLNEKVGTKPPAWFKDGLLNTDYFPGQHHAFGRSKVGPSYSASGSDREVNDGSLLTISGDKVTIARKGKSVDSTEKLVGLDRMSERVAVECADGLFLCAVHGNYSGGYPYKLVALDEKSGLQKWQADVWAARRGGSTGIGHHDVSMVVDEKAVTLFGMESHGAYVESFELSTGKPIFRFCTSYWFNFSETWKTAWNKQADPTLSDN